MQTPGVHGNLQKLQRPAAIVIVIVLSAILTRPWLALGASGGGEIGVDYGLNGDNLPSPEQTVALLKSKGIARVRLYEARQEITKAFANSGIELLLGISNEMVPKMAANIVEAFNWVTQNVISFPKSGISAIIVGNEWLLDSSHDPALLLPAMLNVYTVLTTTQVISLDLSGIKVSTSHALNVLGISFPPSSAQFNGSLLSVLSPILDFLERTGSFFMVNIFPYFAFVDDPNVSLQFALFEAKVAVQDPKTKLNYTNLFDLQLDAVYAALDAHDSTTVSKQLQPTAARASTLPKQLPEQGSSHRLPTVQPAAQGRKKGSRWRPPRVLVGESGWPSGAGGSGSVPHSQLSAIIDAVVLIKGAFPPRPAGAAHNIAAAEHPPCHVNGAAAEQGASARDDISGSSTADEIEAAADTPSSSCGAGVSARVCVAATVENARKYNQNLIRHVLAASGTPANPTIPIHAFIFSLFNEDLKPPGPEQHYGLFFPNATPVYPITFH